MLIEQLATYTNVEGGENRVWATQGPIISPVPGFDLLYGFPTIISPVPGFDLFYGFPSIISPVPGSDLRYGFPSTIVAPVPGSVAAL